MKTILRDTARTVLSPATWRQVDRRIATDHALRRAIVASGTGLAAVCYLLAISAAR